MKLYHWLLLCLVFSCQSKKTEKLAKLPVASKEDTAFSYCKLLHIPSKEQEGSQYYEYFLQGKKLLQLSDSLAFTNDYEIRLYIFGSFGPAKCFRYTLTNEQWKGEEIYKTDFSSTPPKRNPVYPYFGWKVFIENAIKNGLLEMPTIEQMEKELRLLSKLYPSHAMIILDGQAVMIELISKDSYELRMYDRRYDSAIEFPIEKYPEAVVLNKINNLVLTLTQLKRLD